MHRYILEALSQREALHQQLRTLYANQDNLTDQQLVERLAGHYGDNLCLLERHFRHYGESWMTATSKSNHNRKSFHARIYHELKRQKGAVKKTLPNPIKQNKRINKLKQELRPLCRNTATHDTTIQFIPIYRDFPESEWEIVIKPLIEEERATIANNNVIDRLDTYVRDAQQAIRHEREVVFDWLDSLSQEPDSHIAITYFQNHPAQLTQKQQIQAILQDYDAALGGNTAREQKILALNTFISTPDNALGKVKMVLLGSSGKTAAEKQAKIRMRIYEERIREQQQAFLEASRIETPADRKQALNNLVNRLTASEFYALKNEMEQRAVSDFQRVIGEFYILYIDSIGARSNAFGKIRPALDALTASALTDPIARRKILIDMVLSFDPITDFQQQDLEIRALVREWLEAHPDKPEIMNQAFGELTNKLNAFAVLNQLSKQNKKAISRYAIRSDYELHEPYFKAWLDWKNRPFQNTFPSGRTLPPATLIEAIRNAKASLQN